MVVADEDKTTCHTEEGTFCYTEMPFGLLKIGASYQRLVVKVFEQQIGRNVNKLSFMLVCCSRFKVSST